MHVQITRVVDKPIQYLKDKLKPPEHGLGSNMGKKSKLSLKV